MSERVALVTGASQGIGAATAKALAADGYKVLVHYGHNHTSAEGVVDAIRATGGAAATVGADLAQADAPRQLVDRVKALSGGRLDALVLNAGTMPGDSSLLNCTPEIFDTIAAVNFRSPFFVLQGLAPVLSDGASVVAVSSVTARRAIGAVAAYASLKFALESLVRRAAVELGPRWIRVNGVAPSTIASETVRAYVETEQGRAATVAMQAMKRVGQPEDVADVIAFLVSNHARWITGAVIPVDGGTAL